MPLSDSSSRAEIYTHCHTYTSLTAENTLQNVRQLIQCIYTYKSTHKLPTLEEAFDAHRKMTLEGRKRMSRKRKAVDGMDLAPHEQQQQQPPPQPQPQPQSPPLPLQQLQLQQEGHLAGQESKEADVKDGPCTQTSKELELLRKQLNEKEDRLVQLGQVHSQLSRYCSLLEERLKVLDMKSNPPEVRETGSIILSLNEWQEWKAWKQMPLHLHNDSVPRLMPAVVAVDEEMKCDVDYGEIIKVEEDKHLRRPAPLVIKDDEVQWQEDDSSLSASVSGGTSTPSVHHHQSSTSNDASPHANASPPSTSHKVFTFSHAKNRSSESIVEPITEHTGADQHCVADTASPRRSMVEDDKSPRFNDKRGSNYNAWYRYLFLPRYGGEALRKFFGVDDQQRLDISVDQMQSFCLPGIADSISEAEQFDARVKVFRSLLVTNDQNEWKGRTERNVYDKLHLLSASQPTVTVAKIDRVFVVAFLHDSEQDLHSTNQSQASYILLEFVCKTKQIYYYDVLEQLLEEDLDKLQRRERVMDFISAFRTHKKAQSVFEHWAPAASVQFDVERSRQSTLALSSWWCLSMLLSRAQVKVKSRRMTRGAKLPYIKRDTKHVEHRSQACPAAGSNHPWSMAHDQVKLWLLCVWNRMDRIRPCVAAKRAEKRWEEGDHTDPPAKLLLDALLEQ